jgi:hypothetical protein
MRKGGGLRAAATVFVREIPMIRIPLSVAAVGLGLLSAPCVVHAQAVGVAQLSSPHRATIQQSGRANLAAVTHLGEGHRADVIQAGRDNAAHLVATGSGNRQTVSQHGDSNFAAQFSAGQGNRADILQGMAGAEGNRNIALQAQAGAGNVAVIRQRGDRNLAAQAQIGQVSVQQAARAAAGLASDLRRGRTARIGELSSLSGGIGNRAEITQDNDDNLAVMLQSGNHNSLDVHQSGGAANVYVQVGDGLNRSAYVDQRAGVNGVTPITIIQSR